MRQHLARPLVVGLGVCTYLVAGSMTVTAGDVPAGFINHGILAPVGQASWNGVVATADAEGNPLIFVKFWGGIDDHQTYYLLIDARTGETTQVDLGHTGRHGGAWDIFLSPDNKLYDTLGPPNEHVLVEFDIATRTLSEIAQLPASVQRIVTFTIDDNGIIWAASDPGAELFSFDPQSRKLINHGAMAEKTWRQYPTLAADDGGWVYATIVFQEGNILAYNSVTGERRELLAPERRKSTTSTSIWRATDGAVYAHLDSDKQWYRLHQGEITPVDEPLRDTAVHGNTTTTPGHFPDGSKYTSIDVPNRRAFILDAEADEPRRIDFTYSGTAKSIYSMIEGPDGLIYGSSAIPLRVFRFDPATGESANWGLGSHGGHVNQWVRQGDKLYGIVYGDGDLIEYDPSEPFDDAAIRVSANPRRIHGGGEAQRLYGRPLAALAHPDAEHVLMSGIPYRGDVGAGLYIYNVRTAEEQVLRPDDLVPDQGIQAMAALPDGDVLLGSTTAAGTGGTRVAKEAVISRLDWETRTIAETWVPVPGASSITDLIVPRDGLIYGLAPGGVFFVLDPETGELIHTETITEYGGMTGTQASRVMALGPDGHIYVLFRDAIARIVPGTFRHQEVARPGVPITAGITIADGRLYFASDRHLWSYDLGL